MEKIPLFSVFGLDTQEPPWTVFSFYERCQIESGTSGCDVLGRLHGFLDGHPLVLIADLCPHEFVVGTDVQLPLNRFWHRVDAFVGEDAEFVDVGFVSVVVKVRRDQLSRETFLFWQISSKFTIKLYIIEFLHCWHLLLNCVYISFKIIVSWWSRLRFRKASRNLITIIERDDLL